MLSLTTLTAAFAISIIIITLPFANDVQYRAEFIQFSSLAFSNDVGRNCFPVCAWITSSGPGRPSGARPLPIQLKCSILLDCSALLLRPPRHLAPYHSMDPELIDINLISPDKDTQCSRRRTLAFALGPSTLPPLLPGRIVKWCITIDASNSTKWPDWVLSGHRSALWWHSNWPLDLQLGSMCH